jgi:hypothetical protein
MKKVVLILVLLFISNDVFAKFDLGVQYKPRFEYRDGYRMLQPMEESNPAAFVSQRTRIIADYFSDDISTRISLQDARVWGDEIQVQSQARVALHEAWLQLNLGSGLFLKAGRQELVYDDHRLLGNLEWAQQARSHDGALLKWIGENSQLHLGFAFNQSAQNVFETTYNLNNYKGLAMIWFENKVDKENKFSLIGVADFFEESGNFLGIDNRGTFGGNYYHTGEKLELQGTAYYQIGRTVTDADIAAYMFSAQGFYNLGEFKIGAGIDYLSGNDRNSESFNSFNTLYATNHKFYGFMDHFLNIPNDTRGAGLVDIYAKLKYQFAEKWNANLDFHSFSSEQPFLDFSTGEEIDKALATEIDLVVKNNFNSFTTIFLGASMLFPTDDFKTLQSRPFGDNSTWLWAMISVKPTIFSSE